MPDSKKTKWQCPNCQKETSQDRQFCEHCLYNVGFYYSPFKNINWPDTNLMGKRQKKADKHIKDLAQPWTGDKPNEKFARMYKNEPEKLKKIYSDKELRRLGMPKLVEK